MKNLKTILFYFITFGAAIFLLWYVYDSIDVIDPITNKKIPTSEFLLNTLKEGNYTLLFISAVCAILAHAVRAERWRLLLDPLGHKMSLKEGFLSVMISYFINLIIPRGGEVSRSVAVHRMNKKIPVNAALGTIVAERIIDVLFLLACIGVGFIIEFDNLTKFFDDYLAHNPGEPGSYNKLIILGASGIIFLLIVVILFKKVRKLNRWYKEKILGFLNGLKDGLLSVFKLKKSGLFIFYSFLIWILYYLMTYSVLKAFPETEHLGLLAALSIFAIGGVAMAIPLPGGTGSYHKLVPLGMIWLYQITPNEASAFAFIFHGWQTLVVIILGAISLIVSNKITKKRKLEASQNQTI